MVISLKPDDKKNNLREKTNDHRNLRDASTKAENKSKEADHSSTVLSDLTFVVVAAQY